MGGKLSRSPPDEAVPSAPSNTACCCVPRPTPSPEEAEAGSRFGFGSPARVPSPACPLHSAPKRTAVVSPFVLSRWSPLLVDSEGDTADEFWEEGRRGRMSRVTAGLRPLGWVDYAIPRLRPDLPFVMFEATGNLLKRPFSKSSN